ncbi:MAG: hypothetical protein D6730_02800 [Bacteroidetes bacterium]|nr:MAG: hypothetical protein D6730_02800 [Bacteroidota bacterium]
MLPMLMLGCSSTQKATRLWGEELFQSWVHTHEESSPELMVFRPAGHDLPLSRNREGFEIRKDGTFVHTTIGKRDYPETVEAHWKVKKSIMVVQPENEGHEAFSLEIVELAPDRLAVKKQALSK